MIIFDFETFITKNVLGILALNDIIHAICTEVLCHEGTLSRALHVYDLGIMCRSVINFMLRLPLPLEMECASLCSTKLSTISQSNRISTLFMTTHPDCCSSH